MEELLAASQFENLVEGKIIKGTITEIRENEVVLDIGAKAEGIVPGHEFIDMGDLQVGSEIEVFLEKLEDREGNPIVSYDKAQQKKNWENILSKCEEGSILAGRVKAKVKGGLIVNIGVTHSFPPRRSTFSPRRIWTSILARPTTSRF